MRMIPVVILCIVIIAGCNTENTKQPLPGALSHATEEAAIKKAVADAYKVISFKKGERVNYDSIRNCFMPQAQLFNFSKDSLEIMTIDQFIDVYKNLISSNGITSFYEEEIKGTTDQFGRIAQRISTYKTYINTMDSAAERGVNSFQLIKTANGWKVSSIIWDAESAKLKIPAYYLDAE
jgi:hypothetical protein